MKIPKSHPRYTSLKTRQLLEKGVRDGITSLNGLIAHGRGEAFDYLLGEKTHKFAREAIDAGAALLVLAKRPVISVNGNTAVLVPHELVHLSKLLNAPLEVNLFHTSEERLRMIKSYLEKFGAMNALLPSKKCKIAHLNSPRKYINPEGIYKADVVFVPLEDGDRTEALVKNGKKVITVDLNPLSRTAQRATVTIVDNVVRAMPLLIEEIKKQKRRKINDNDNATSEFKNFEYLKRAEKILRKL
ncbi:MAG: phosphopantothenate/pantothenate synthetase [Candidatus Levybacteria bacterium]|nr:phosphopantothenate/pantothenate synthetase [Candidatus Levybacteria bacterium]